MEGREERGPGYDDWFDEPEPLSETQSGAARGDYESADEVWVLPEEERRLRTRVRRDEISIGGLTLTTAQAAIIVVSVIAVLLGILAAVGAFNGGGKAAIPPVTTPSTPTTASTSTQTNTTPAVQAPTQPLTLNNTGPQVKLLQRALTALGYSPGKADGDYGPSTQSAVEQFQTAKKLTVDGVVGPKTLAALQAALAG